VLYLEKALRLTPRDGDVEANLRLVEPPPNRAHERVWLKPLLSLTFDEWLFVFFLFYVLSALLWAIRFWMVRAERIRLIKVGAIIFSGVAIILGSCVALSYYYTRVARYGVVLVQGAVVRSGPDERFNEVIRAPEGLKLAVEPYQDPEWKVVHFPDGQFGYIRSMEIHEI